MTTGQALHRFFMSLQDGLAPGLLAGRAKIVKGLLVGTVILKAVHKRTGWRLPQCVAVKLGAQALLQSGLLMHQQKLCLQRYIGKLRILHLTHQLEHKRVDLSICDRLLALSDLLDAIEYVDRSLEGTSTFVQELKQAFDLVNSELHGPLRKRLEILHDAPLK